MNHFFKVSTTHLFYGKCASYLLIAWMPHVAPLPRLDHFMKLTLGDIILDHYCVRRVLGAGAMGEVYLGEHVGIGNLVAIKVLTHDADERTLLRFEREAQLMARVRHPNVVSIHDFGASEQGLPVIVMEYVKGCDIESLINDKGVMEWRQALGLIIQILDGLAVLHEQGIVHRDLKLSNLMYTSVKPRTLKITDFGTARSLELGSTKLTADGMMVGTPAYMAPELLLGDKANVESDLYSVGLIFYEMISGTLPFEAFTMSQVLKRLKHALPAPKIPDGKPELPPELLTYVMERLLAPCPTMREDSALTVKRELKILLKAYDAQSTRIARDSGADLGLRKAMIFKQRKRPTPKEETNISSLKETVHISQELLEASILKTIEETPSQEFSRREAVTSRSIPSIATYALSEQEPHRPAPVEQLMRPRAVVLAKFTPSQLTNRVERSWLGQLVSQRGRAFVFGERFWIAVIVGAQDSDVQTIVSEIQQAIYTRYGTTQQMRWCPLNASFRLSPAALSGSAEMPKEIQALLDRLS